MSFTPTQMVFQPPLSADPMGEALVVGLHRKANRRRPWGAAQTVLGAGITFGILPLIIWPMRFLDTANFEYRQLEDLLDWLAGRRGEAEIAPAREALKRAKLSSADLLQMWFIAAAVVLLIVEFVFKSGFDWRSLYHATILRPWDHENAGLSAREQVFYCSWVLSLAFAYSLHFYHMLRHAVRMRLFTESLRAVLASAEVEEVRWYRPGISMKSFWMPMGLLLALILGVFWAVPAMIAGEYQKRYILYANPYLRRDLADRVKSMMAVNPSTPQ